MSQTFSGSNWMDGCIFCGIGAREVRAEVIYEDDLLMAVADICPIRVGHSLIIPRHHYEYFEDLPDEEAARIVCLGQRLSRAMKSICHIPRVAFLFTGGDHPHVHAHVVPMHEKTDITSRRYIAEDKLTFRPMPHASGEDLSASANALRIALERRDGR